MYYNRLRRRLQRKPQTARPNFDALQNPSRLQEICNTNHENDARFTMADAPEEYTAEATAGLFSSEAGSQDFVNWLQSENRYTAAQKKTVLQKAAELLQKIFERIKELLRDGHLSSVAKDFAQAQADEASRMRQMFLKVLDGMEVNQSTVDSQQSTEGKNKYSLKDIEKYNAKTYNERGWALVNDVLTENEHRHFMEQVSDNKNLSFVYPTKNGETMLLVSDNADNNYTKLVYYKGTFKNPIITKVIDIDETNSFAKSIMLQEVLENEQDGFDGCELINHITGAQVCSVRTKENFDPYRKQTAKYKSQSHGKSYSYLFDGAERESDADDSGSVKNSLRMAETPSVASGDSSPRGGAMETAEAAAQIQAGEIAEAALRPQFLGPCP